MDKEKLINKVSNELVHGKNIDFTFEINGIPYSIKFLSPNNDLHISIPSIIAIPLTQKFNNQLIVEANNMESDNLDVVLQQGIQTGIRLAHITDNLPCTIVVPLIPSYRDKPYFQQLSKECFELDKEDRNYRIDEQIVRIIQQAKMFSEETKGLPEPLLDKYLDEKTIRIPMLPTLRSLNLSNSVAIITYEILRQHNFEDLQEVSTYFDNK